jgi:hypothetical protein
MLSQCSMGKAYQFLSLLHVLRTVFKVMILLTEPLFGYLMYFYQWY